MRPDHPMVKYAKDFTKYFDLIAERKSAVFHLREVAKVCVLAKYLLEAPSVASNMKSKAKLLNLSPLPANPRCCVSPRPDLGLLTGPD
eukprot:5784100-Amphidinium_carterae.2